ncbi:uncharacterized protein LOC133792837 [Humulus lupulus]|uniref:uncharacterized protein LOC133792837 n=1 Tax=Humulus lupulus TaxID=3486 RepID=UPI002B41111B|nr:uncharacterized protein LOC133792837 [Humulus lupulus]
MDEVDVEGDINTIEQERILIFNPSVDMANPRFRLQMEFSSKKVKVTTSGVQYVIDLNAKTCAFQRSKLNGIPCTHALACIRKNNWNLEDFVDDFYSKEAYQRTYTPIIKGTNGPESWPNPRSHPLEPLIIKKRSGRPKKKRRREAGEPPAATKVRKYGLIMHCKKCGKACHNSKTCGKTKGKKNNSYKSKATNKAEGKSSNLNKKNKTT